MNPDDVKHFLISLTADLCAVIPSTLILAILGFLGGRAFIRMYETRTKVFSFFGIEQGRVGVKIYVARIRVKPYGTVEAKGGKIGKGYHRDAISEAEYRGGLLVQRLLSARRFPFLSEQTQDWLNHHFPLLFASIEPEICVSPAIEQVPRDVNIIVIGSNAYNEITGYYLQKDYSPFYFDLVESDDHTQDERILKNRYSGNVKIAGRSDGIELGVIQRVRIVSTGRVVIICAGIGTASTFQCLIYLVEKWRALEKRFGDGNFALCLKFRGLQPDPPEPLEARLWHHINDTEYEKIPPVNDDDPEVIHDSEEIVVP